jgi:hypothetical protein
MVRLAPNLALNLANKLLVGLIMNLNLKKKCRLPNLPQVQTREAVHPQNSGTQEIAVVSSSRPAASASKIPAISFRLSAISVFAVILAEGPCLGSSVLTAAAAIIGIALFAVAGADIIGG